LELYCADEVLLGEPPATPSLDDDARFSSANPAGVAAGGQKSCAVGSCTAARVIEATSTEGHDRITASSEIQNAPNWHLRHPYSRALADFVGLRSRVVINPAIVSAFYDGGVVDAEPAGRRFSALSGYLDERQRRLLLAVEAKELGRGGVSALSNTTGAARSTIQAGMRELSGELVEDALPAGRSRRAGAGRKKAVVADGGLADAIEALVEPDTRGDPESPLRWTLKSTRQLADAVTAAGHPVSSRTVAHILEDDLGYSLQANRKAVEGKQHPDRDAQFRYINEQVRRHSRRGEPVLSVDTKKKELIGDFKNNGRRWRPEKSPEKVKTHDFIDPELGKAIPYGIWDLRRNRGWVSVGIDHDTAAFAVAALRSWWTNEGCTVYPRTRRLLICADAGGSNSYRNRLWKVELARLAADTGLAITVCHFPPGTSKFNKIEHRLWAQVTSNWRGLPLTSREVIVNLIGATTTRTGLTVHAQLDQGRYPSGVKVSDDEMAAIRPRLESHDFHGDWNYTLRPRRRRG
jgi:hypothetical protein